MSGTTSRATPSPTPKLINASLSITVPTVPPSTVLIPSTCNAAPGYTDISSGAQVVVKNEHGSVILTSTLGDGAYMGSDLGHCKFSFALDDLPLAKIYQIHVGNSFRGVIDYTPDQIEANPNFAIG
ncbi:hypothetical protein GCM10022286_05710 [Gryllotalpicola daejeonensis]|uniref:Uncharacterized protein n=1 Tax=Gryllotalpicola daejeonensis TaxID=993087 RepID=A0ABP7ZF94_9MICO